MDRNKIRIKLGILSLSTVTGAGSAITSIIPIISLNYPNQSLSNIESLVTITSLSALLSISINSLITKKIGIKNTISIGIKNTISIGLFLGSIMGILPFCLQSYSLILLSRIILGLAIGLYSPHAISLISYFYKGEERATLLGFQMGITALGNAILLLICGVLSYFNWRFTFFVYAFLGVIGVVVKLFVPSANNSEEIKKSTREKLSPQLKKLLILCFFTFLIIWGVQLKLPTFIVHEKIGNTATSSTLLALMNIAGMLAGMSFGYFYKKAKKMVLPIGFLGAAVSVLILTIFKGKISIFIFGILFNFIYSFTGPYITLQINSQAKQNQLTKVNSLLMVSMIGSAFLAPYIWNTLTGFFGSSSNTVVSFWLMITALFTIGVFLLIYSLKSKDNFGDN
ncbi:MFS transporter [Clostridium intestinale]|uniref:MFS transporter n=1 Tax=Clostridium intestinale TaxID=36845 RepID=UPI0028F0C7D9|nr:MFS transporter [Clostridium intestinale]